jgi:hypothetical protein
MILFDLICDQEHEFEAWFASSEAFGKLKAAKAVSCPHCGSNEVSKALMAPKLSRKVGEEKRMSAEEERTKVRAALKQLRKTVEDTSDYVGKEFPEEARKMHYGESEKRNIYGEASEDEAKELSEEGVPVTQIPWIEKDN